MGRSEDVVRILEAAIPNLRSELGPASPGIAPHVINLSFAYSKLGRYGDEVKLLEETIAAIPEKDRVAYINLDFILNNLGGCYLSLDDLAGAQRVWTQQEHYLRSRYPADSLALAAGLVMLGQSLLEANLFPESERVLREAVAIRQSKEPNGRGVLVAKVLLGMALAGQKRFADAEPLLATGCSQLEARWQPLPSKAKEIVDLAQRRLAILYAQTGNSAKAVEICRRNKELLEKSSRTDPESLYNAACWYSVSTTVFKAASGSDATHLAGAEADRAMALLKQAATAGFKDVAQMKLDEDLAALRGREDFKKLLVELRPSR
jgi:tetratricopeptide (TPR) repeat protein